MSGVVDHEGNAALFRMAEKVGGLESSVRSLTEQWRNQDEKASQGRRDLHQKIDALRDDVQELDGMVKAAIADIATMKPIVDEVGAVKQQTAGAVKAGRWFSRGLYWSAMLLTLGAGWVLTHWLDLKVTVRQ